MLIRYIQKIILEEKFTQAYELLAKSNYSYSFSNLSRDFPKVDAKKMYFFLMYSISQSEDLEKHVSICNYLYFMDPYMNGADSLIKWHLIRALELFPNRKDVLINWILSVYSGNPDCPFTEEEMNYYRYHSVGQGTEEYPE